MDFNQVKEIINIIDKSTITDFDLGFENTKINISKNGSITTHNSQSTGNNEIDFSYKKEVEEEKTEQVASSKDPITIMPTETVVKKEGFIVKAPLVGTFYDSASPQKPPFVSIGTKVKKGDVLAIVEAMKIMNEITSQYDGEIVEVLVSNEDAVEYGQDLFRIV